MIPCQKCAAQNLIGAIFCRSCGTKLNLDEIRPNTIHQHEESVKRNIGGILRRTVSVVALLAVVGVLIGSFMAVPLPGGAIDAKTANVALRKYQSLLTRSSRDRSMTFSSAEVTAIANYIFALDKKQQPDAAGDAAAAAPPQAATLEPVQLGVQILNSGYVHAVLKSSLLGKLDVYSTIVGRFEHTEQGVTFTMLSAKAGKVPMKFGTEKVILGRFAVLVQNHADLENLRKRIGALDYQDDNVAIAIARGR